MPIKILHTGDIHLGSFSGPEKNGENLRMQDIVRCMDAMLADARVQQPDIALLAGDLFHQARVWSDRGLREQSIIVKFIRELAAICPVVAMRGTPNHDSMEQFQTLLTTFLGNSDVHIVTEPCVAKFATANGSLLQVVCLPGFDPSQQHVADMNGLSEGEYFTHVINQQVRDLRAQCDPSMPAVLMGHHTVTGANMESGQTAFFSETEPVILSETLADVKFDLACFGHIHQPQQLKNCDNAFYCGAISALNFNDENQPRGYYMHTLQDDGSLWSEFCKLPTREFLTIKLNDDEIGKLIDGAMSLEQDARVKDKIVRVQYNCTDVHNKAFQSAVLERQLYQAGAFWVSDISPVKIEMTVNKMAMDSDNTPEDNLIDYCILKEFDDKRTGELVSLAQPIMDEVLQHSFAEHQTGLFTPMQIKVQNYRNYVDETFDFSSVRFCTVNGDNGVGKSSLFMDAILDALFEEPREGDLTGWIRNDPSVKSGMIEFTFSVGDKVFQVTRTRQKRGKATLHIAELVDGKWVDRSGDKTRYTQQVIENIIGMDSMTLRSCALIMQDQYGLFLSADKESRMDILSNILGLGVYDSMEELASVKLTDTNREIRTRRTQISTILEGLPDAKELDAKLSDVKARSADLERAIQLKTAELTAARAVLDGLNASAERLKTLNLRKLTLQGQLDDKQKARQEQEQIIKSANEMLAKAEEIKAGTAKYRDLLEQEKSMIQQKAMYDAVMKQLNDASLILKRTEAASKSAEKKVKAALDEMKKLEVKPEEAERLTAVHESYESVSKEIALMESRLPVYKTTMAAIQEIQSRMKTTVSAYERQRDGLMVQINGLKQKIAILENSGCPDIEHASCRFLVDAKAAQKQLPDMKQKLDDTEKQYQADCKALQEELDAAQSKLEADLEEKLAGLRDKLKSLDVDEKAYQAMQQKAQTRVLLQEQVDERRAALQSADGEWKQAQSDMERLQKQADEMKSVSEAYDVLQKELKQYASFPEQSNALAIASERKTVAEKRVAELGAEILVLDNDRIAIDSECRTEQAKTAGITEAMQSVVVLEKQAERLQADMKQLSVTLGGLEQQKADMTEKLKQTQAMQDEIRQLAVVADNYEELKRAFGQDGIRHNIIRSVIPIFEATASSILGQMSQGRMGVEFVTERVLKSNSKKEVTALDIIITDSVTGRLPYLSRSGGERVKAALSVVLALAEIKSRKAGIQLGFLFIDEPPYLDGPGVQAYCDALETIQSRYSDIKVMAITHDVAMKGRFPQSVDVVKTSQGSKILRA